MARKSLGILTLDLVAKIGGFEQGLDKAGRASEKWRKKVRQDIAKASKAFAGLATAAVAGLAAITVQTTKNAREIQNLSKVANTNSQDFQKMTFAASRYGVEQEKVADILKDVNDKVGDFLQTGGGPLKDFFENIAPLVGVTANEFKNLSGDQALQLYVDSLEAANLSQADMTFYMEAIASDATKLLPLLSKNGKELKTLGDEAERTGNVFSDMDFEQLQELDRSMLDFEATLTGLKNEVVMAALPAINDMMDALSDPRVVEGIKQIADALISFTSAIVTATAETANFTKFVAEELAAAVGGPALDDIPRVEDHVASLTERLEQLDNKSKKFGGTTRYAKQIEETRKELELYQNALDNFYNTGSAFGVVAAPAEAETPELPSAPMTPTLWGIDIDQSFVSEAMKKAEERGKAAKKEAERLTKEIADQVAGWEEQAKTIGFTTEELAIYKLEQMGATDAQIQAVKAAQQELELFEQKKQAAENYKSLVGELRTDEEKITDELYKRLDIIQQASGIADEDKQKQTERAIDGAFVGFEDGGALGSEEKIEEERKQLEDWYSEQLELLEQFRKDRADLNEEWNEKEAELKQEYEERQTEIELANEELRRQQRQDGYMALLDVMGKYFEGMEGKEAAYARAAIQIGKTLLDEKKRDSLESIWTNTYDAAMGAYNAMASIPIVGPFLGAAAAGAVIVTGTAAAASVMGMAHDGIDSVPADGTWLLQKGERVTTAETSAKLDNTLDRVMKSVNTSGRGAGGVTQNISVEGRPDRRTAKQMAQESAKKQRITSKRYGVGV